MYTKNNRTLYFYRIFFYSKKYQLSNKSFQMFAKESSKP